MHRRLGSIFLFALALLAGQAFGLSITPLPGATPQHAVVNRPFAWPIGVVVRDDDGQPVPGITVRFSADAMFSGFVLSPMPAGCVFDVGKRICDLTTDANGISRLPGAYGTRPNTNKVRADIYSASGLFTILDLIVDPALTVSFQDMWWGGPDQPGWGVAIAQHGDKLFPILFAYDDAGRPTWRVLSDGRWNGDVGTSFFGLMHGPRASPWFDYDASRFEPGAAGYMELGFRADTAAVLRVSNPFVGTPIERPIERFDFSRDDSSALHGVGDMWWGGPSQSGWGVSIMEKPGGLFSMWFTYDETGSATWFVMPDGAWTSADTYEGRMYRATGSPWFDGGYDASKFRTTEVGPYRLRFRDANNARLEYNVDDRSGTLVLERFPFD